MDIVEINIDFGNVFGMAIFEKGLLRRLGHSPDLHNISVTFPESNVDICSKEYGSNETTSSFSATRIVMDSIRLLSPNCISSTEPAAGVVNNTSILFLSVKTACPFFRVSPILTNNLGFTPGKSEGCNLIREPTFMVSIVLAGFPANFKSCPFLMQIFKSNYSFCHVLF